jgi:hypothetical protein
MIIGLSVFHEICPCHATHVAIKLVIKLGHKVRCGAFQLH